MITAPKRSPWRLRLWLLSLTIIVGAGGLGALDRWIASTPLPELAPAVSATVLDRKERLLRAYQVSDGRWRLPVDVAEVDPEYLAQLLAYEDRRFYDHGGVDLIAMARAVGQTLAHGRPVSGASTLTMQVARLLMERRTRTVSAKLSQVRLALALERRLSKTQIQTLYLTLAPFGGNIEGVRAASLTWFGKEPRRLTPAQAALLVALPQAPNARRPDRSPKRAKAARSRVLARSVAKGVLASEDARAAEREPIPTKRRPFPQNAPHLADRLATANAAQDTHHVTLDRTMQRSVEALVRERAGTFSSAVSIAAMVADHQTGEVLVSVGSPGQRNDARQGFVDMTRAVRSPGSTLKPLIYGLAFEHGVAHPESMVEDRPTAFGGYVPTNFDDGYRGTVSVRRALQYSLNVPAVALLDAVGPSRLLSRMRRAGMHPKLPLGKAPGLAIGLGGLGVTLQDLVSLYVGIARGGMAISLKTQPSPDVPASRILDAGAAWQVTDVLANAPAPQGAPQGKIAFKTGTSYGYRDAWAVGYDGRYVVGVWVGRPDAAPVPGSTGIKSAAPLLFEVFSRVTPEPVPFAPPPGDVLIVSNAELPAPLRRVRMPGGLRRAGPEIAFPPDGAHVATDGQALALKVRDGRPPFTWLIDGKPVETRAIDREAAWLPDGPGFVAISVIDAIGQSAQARIFLE